MSEQETTLGKILKQARDQQSQEISHIANFLKVKISDLEAIENEDWQNINIKIYKTGLIRSYARFLQIDSEKIEDKIKNLPFASNIKNVKHQLINTAGESDLSPNREMFFNFFLISILMFFVLLIIYNSLEKKSGLFTSQIIIEEMQKFD